MQRRAFERQLAADPPVEAEDPVEQQRSALATLTIPTLVARGEFEMPDFHTGAQELAAELPAAREVVITGAGHLAPLEQPDAFRALLLDLLAG